MLGIYNDTLQAYSQPELFDPVIVEIEKPKEVSYALPVCIEAVPLGECDLVFLVKPNPLKEGKHIFAPRKKDAIQFATVKEAQDYIDNTLKPAYGERWSYNIWSIAALPK